MTSAEAEGSLRVLVVEDNEDVGEMMVLLLRAWGHEVELRADGLSGLDAARSEDFDLLVLDLGLPGIDGFELARRVRALPTPREPVLVALSGYSLPEHVARARQAGFDRHLAKPIDDAKLRAMLRLARRRRDRPLTVSSEIGDLFGR